MVPSLIARRVEAGARNRSLARSRGAQQQRARAAGGGDDRIVSSTTGTVKKSEGRLQFLKGGPKSKPLAGKPREAAMYRVEVLIAINACLRGWKRYSGSVLNIIGMVN